MNLTDYFKKIKRGDLTRAFKKSAFWRKCRSFLQEFDPLLRDAPTTKTHKMENSSKKPWELLLQDLQALVAKLSGSSSDATELLDEIETTVFTLRVAAAERHKQWVDAFFRQLQERCAENPSLRSMAPDITRLQLNCSETELSPTQLIDRLVTIGNIVETNFGEYSRISEKIRDKEASLAELIASIGAVSLQERQQLRHQEQGCREELAKLRNQLFDVESSLSAALDIGPKALSRVEESNHNDSLGGALTSAIPQQAAGEIHRIRTANESP
jgi:chromosome segregation ATPase